jgi:hypothetical protein
LKPKKFATQIDEDVLIALKKYAHEADKSISRVITEAVSEFIQKRQLRKPFMSAMNEVLDDHAELLERLAK